MIKKFTFSFLLLVGSLSYGQRLLVEDFNYSTGQLTNAFLPTGQTGVSGGIWKSVTTDQITDLATVGTGNLTYPNYYTGPTGSSNLIRLDSATSNQGRSIEDVYRDFTAVTKASNSAVYASFLVQFRNTLNLSANGTNFSGDYFMAFATTNAPTDYRSRVFVRKGTAENTIQFGISPTSFNATNSPIVWSNVDRDASATHLVTFAFQFVAGNNNDVVKLFVDKPYSATEPTADASFVFNGTEPEDLSRIVIRQATANSPVADLDAIVVGTTYASVSLPLNLTSFTGSLVNRAALLSWASTNEVNVKGFAVEKGLNGTDFSEIAFVSAKNTASQNNYSFEDINVKGGTNYYRLNMIDKDGSSRFSSVVLVNNNAILSAQVFPNPAKSNLNVTHAKALKGATIKILDLNGKLLKIYPVQAGASQTGLGIAEMTKGNYVVVFENNGTKSVTQFSKQ